MRLLVLPLVCFLVFGIVLPSRAATEPRSHSATQPLSRLEIGFLIIAIDVQPDHLRISEGLRISNSGPPQVLSLRIPLPAGATYVTFHKGLQSARGTPEGFGARVDLPAGVTEIAYSYALAAARDAVLTRTYPLPARRIEVAVRGVGVGVAVRDGSTLPPVDLRGGSLRRWEVRDLAAGSPLVVRVSGLPSRRSRAPVITALALAILLAAALLIGLRRKGPTPLAEKDHPST